ncbi:LysR family transcriptional regulator [Ramlibacter pallidus]|uniref:LysR family transcriptional regulator n=1 Tax=Ramlibacter pallidus TaxID=2780087 RepID=A0ABR9S7T1_9BURK|nr:LysR family transcriptional regulator [Ramlibacter pallidus]MBE7369545.1 LysR family transcriptional regulator [Ramlibacter pallidus]
MDRLKAMGAYVRAVELGSLSAAARELGTTQPTVSKLVAALERELGARLLERSTRRVLPTEEGARFLASARRLLEDYEEALDDIAGGVREPRGLVRLSAPVALGELRLNRLMLQVLAKLPRVQVELLLEDRFVDPVEERIDLMVRIGGTLPPDLVARQLAAWPRYFVAAPSYVRASGRPRRPQDLRDHAYLRYAGSDEIVTLTGRKGSMTLELDSRYRVNSAIALLEAVQGGAGVALQPSWMVDALLRQGRLVRLLPQWTGPAQTAHLVHAPRRRLPARVQAVMEALVAAVPTW